MNKIPNSVDVAEPPARPAQPETIPPASPRPLRTGLRSSTLAWLGRTLPTLLVLVALASLASWGHHHGWKLPKFSSLNGSASAEEDDWCKAHSVPESQCVECKPELFPKGKDYGWCRKHGVHNCALDHPDVAQLPTKPEVSQADLERARRGLATRERPENNSKCLLYRRRIQFASPAALAKAGVDIAIVEERPTVEFIAANGEITYDQTRVARLATPVPGIVWRVEKAKGQRVAEGEVLAFVNAAKVGEAKAEFLHALTEVDLEKKTLARLESLQGRIVAGKDLPEAEARLRKAQIRLVSAQQALVNLGLPIRAEDVKDLAVEELARRVQFLGLPEALARALDPMTTTANLIPVRAPFGGIVVERHVVASEVVETSKTLFVVADTSQMWLTLHVRQEEAKHLALGLPVRFRADSGAAETAGNITQIDTAVDEKTKTLKVRADLPNPDGRLRASTFGAGRIILREEPNAVAVPSEAVHWDGSCNVVFVRDKDFLKEGAPKVFHTRTIRPGVKDAGYTEILAGLLPGEVVAAKGSDVLRAELLKNNLGAG